MGQLEEIGERDGWICWLCDQPVDREMSSNDPRGPGREKVPRTLDVSPVVLFTPRASAFAVAEDLPWVYTPGSNAAVIAIHKAVIAFHGGAF